MDTKESTLIGNQDPTKIIIRIMQGINPGEFLPSKGIGTYWEAIAMSADNTNQNLHCN